MKASRTVLLLALSVVAMGVGALFQATGALHGGELSAVDARFHLRGAQAPPTDVVIVGADTKTLSAQPDDRPPFNRARHAKVIEELTKAGASVIAYDFQFTTASDDPDADGALYDAVQAAKRRIVLATGDVSPRGETEILGGAESLQATGATPADNRYLLDDSGTADAGIEDAEGTRIRRMPFSLSHLPSLPMAAAGMYLGHSVKTSGRDAWIDFPGPPGTIPVLSFDDVERGRFDAAAVKGKIVVVGATAVAADDQLATSTSGGGLMSRAEVDAASIQTALRGFPLRAAPTWLDWLFALTLGLVAPLLALRFRVAIAFAAGLLATVLFLVAAQLAFGQDSIWAIVPPLAAALTGMVGTLLISHPIESPAVNRILDRLTPRGGNQRARRLRALLLLTAALSVVTLALVADAAKLLRSADYSTIDLRFSLRGAQPPRNDVVVVGIDDRTLNTKPKPTYPLGRELYATVIRNLTKAGASTIAIDVQFTEESPKPKSDAQLIEAVHDARKVVLSTTENETSGLTSVFSFGKGLAYSRGIPAITLVVKDSDGRVRRMLFSKQKLESFPMAAAEAQAGHRIVTPEGRTAWIDYAGKNLTIKTLSFLDIQRNQFNPADVRGKVVVVGGTASALQDQHNTSTTRNFLMAGPEIQANSIATALEGFPLHEAAWWVDVLLVIAVGVAAPLAGLRFGVRAAVAIGALVVAVFLVGAQFAFQQSDTIVTVVYPLAAGLAGILLTGAIHGLTVAFEREQARDAFARFVPEAVVDQVLADADGVRLGGVRGEATVMFSDLRGFTSFSETLEPERVIESLNRYLTEMSEAILDHGGTLVAYMGDGIMAVFGAPLKQSDHADRALEAAREMLARMDGFNGWLREQGLHDGFKMGIGLNSGPVMSGNVGSERRLEYTALGDTTNTAARLEGMTKGTPHQLFISDTTKQTLTRPADDLVAVGEAEVRGRKAKVLLWSLKDAPEPATPAVPGATVEA
jgi:adenylate cyclase